LIGAPCRSGIQPVSKTPTIATARDDFIRPNAEHQRPGAGKRSASKQSVIAGFAACKLGNGLMVRTSVASRTGRRLLLQLRRQRQRKVR
jgi:hypothetical protein